MRTAIRTCPLCEATCGPALEVDDATRSVARVRGDAGDVFSDGGGDADRPALSGSIRATPGMRDAVSEVAEQREAAADGEPVAVRARTGVIELPAQVTEDVMPGVVCIPHGWGHDAPGTRLRVAAAHAGANANVLTDEQDVEPLSGTAMLNGIPVTLTPVAAPAVA